MQVFNESLKAKFFQILETEAGLELFCYCQINAESQAELVDVAKLLGKPESVFKDALAALSEIGLVIFEGPNDSRKLQFKAVEHIDLKKALEGFLVSHREEYGAAYKKVLTAQIADFLKYKYEENK